MMSLFTAQRFSAVVAILLWLASFLAQGSEFRRFRPIAIPAHDATRAGQAASASNGQVRPVPRRLVSRAVERMLSAWNANRLGPLLADEFYDGSRLEDAMETRVPRDARLELLAIEGSQVLDQKYIDSPSGRLRVSTISVTLRTQLTFNDPSEGYQRREGVNEYILRVRTSAPGHGD